MNTQGGIEVKIGKIHKEIVDKRIGTTFYFEIPNDGQSYYALFKSSVRGRVAVYNENYQDIPENRKEFTITYSEEYLHFVVSTERGKPMYVRYFTTGEDIELTILFNIGNPASLVIWDIPEKLTIAKGQKYSMYYWLSSVNVDESKNHNLLETSSNNPSIVSFIDSFLIEAKSIGTTKIKIKSKVTGLESLLTVEVINPPTFEGKGTLENPYKIRNPTDLHNVRYNLNAVYEQVNDIYLTDMEWLPIGSLSNPFTGVYFGRDNAIHGLKITERFNFANAEIGLFSNTVNASISDLSLIEPRIDTEYYVQTLFPIDRHSIVGCLTGKAINTSVWNCHVVDGYIFTLRDSRDTGGLIGVVQDCYIERCGVNVNNWNDSRIGGLIGYARNTYLINTFAKSTMKLYNGNYGGGLIGYARDCEVVNSYAVPTASHTTYGEILGIIGNDGSYGNYVTRSYYDVDVIKVNRGEGIGLRTSEMMKQSNFKDWNFINVWTIHEGESYPFFGVARHKCLSTMFPLTYKKMKLE